MFCNKCGNEIKEGDKFCNKCGNKVEQEIKENNNENSLNNTVKFTPKDKFLVSIFLIICIAVIGGGIYFLYWVFFGSKIEQQEEKIERDILSALNQDGDSYTNKSTFTKEDFIKEEVVESDYRPIYKVDISNGDTLYIGLIYPNGKDNAMEYFCIGTSLDTVEKSINEYQR